MGKKIRLTLLLGVVFVVGAVAGLFGSSLLWYRFGMAPLTANSLIDAAYDASLLSEGYADKVLKRKLMALTPLTQTYNEYSKYLPDDNSQYFPLWHVQRYYEVSGDEIPAEIKPILDSLPPRPPMTCSERRLFEEAESAVENEPEND